MSDKLCIDLCSGLGGFSQAFVDAGWKTCRVDFDAKFDPEICGDITQDSTFDRITRFTKCMERGVYSKIVVLASPPCERFSVASHAWPKVGIQKGMETVGACLEVIAKMKPDLWMLENPMGRLRWFLGKPTMTLRLSDFGSDYRKLTDFWGNVPLPMVEGMRQHRAYVANSKSRNPLPRPTNDRAIKAKMPYGLSKAILSAVEAAPATERDFG